MGIYFEELGIHLNGYEWVHSVLRAGECLTNCMDILTHKQEN